jgi:hypothetical protein
VATGRPGLRQPDASARRGPVQGGADGCTGRANKEVVGRLETVPLFSACSARELATTARYLKEVDLPADRPIIKEWAWMAWLTCMVHLPFLPATGVADRLRMGCRPLVVCRVANTCPVRWLTPGRPGQRGAGGQVPTPGWLA